MNVLIQWQTLQKQRSGSSKKQDFSINAFSDKIVKTSSYGQDVPRSKRILELPDCFICLRDPKILLSAYQS